MPNKITVEYMIEKLETLLKVSKRVQCDVIASLWVPEAEFILKVLKEKEK